MRTMRPIRNVETRDPAVALTFDACATRSHHYAFDRNVFDVVKRERIPVTIFVSGRWVEGHPDVMAELAADPLVEFGDHSYEHPHMAHLPVARIVAEIDQTEAALAKYGKRSVAFRPPFGEWSSPSGLRPSGAAPSDGDVGRRLGRSERADDQATG